MPLIKPFLRWAGGKTWLQKHILILNQLEFNNYHEPFFGGGATFFALDNQNQSFLSDLNEDLINCYAMIRDNVEGVVEELKQFTNTSEEYYRIRNLQLENPIARAAKFIFLNQTSYNGIYRVNLKGIYNVPYGNRKKPFLDCHALTQASLKLNNSLLTVSDFDSVRLRLMQRDLVFLDPPYTVSHNNNGFIKYNEKLFSLDDQYRLADLVRHIHHQGAYYILTNADHPDVRQIFADTAHVIPVSRASLIGGFNSFRGQTSELIFTNIAALNNNLLDNR